MIRAYIFSLTAGRKNDGSFSPENFIAGISRYGIENPVPCVSQRLQLYGNSRTILEMLAKAEKKYGTLKLKIHTNRYTGANKEDKVGTNVPALGLKSQKLRRGRALDEDNFYEQLVPYQQKIHKVGEISNVQPFPYERKMAKIQNYKFNMIKMIEGRKKGKDPEGSLDDDESSREAGEKGGSAVVGGVRLKV
mmetsp:Transcript_34621/g.52953  ORF Transcript_34621/g.52953 Transcript_34621/m.52953 type:complete len:192 (+) Transcript_34621:3015-3590(+)